MGCIFGDTAIHSTNQNCDPVSQLTSAILREQGALQKAFHYRYDKAANRLSEQIDAGGGSPSTSLNAASVNDLNQITALTGGGRMRFAGSLNVPGTVTIDGEEAYVDAEDDFIGFADVSVGTNTVEIVTSDYSSTAATNNFDVVVTANGSDTVLTYDLNGNLTMTSNATEVVTYEWDTADRLVAIEQDTDRSESTYDGLSRRVRIVEKTNSVTTSDNWIDYWGLCIGPLDLSKASPQSGVQVGKR